LCYFVHSLGAAAVRRGCHLSFPAVALAGLHDFVGIGGDDDVAVIQQGRRTDSFVDPADQEFAGNLA
jgi:hypothetical protein